MTCDPWTAPLPDLIRVATSPQRIRQLAGLPAAVAWPSRGDPRPDVSAITSHARLLEAKGGTIRVLDGGQVPTAPFLDVRSIVVTQNEQGLLGLAFHPAFATNLQYYVYFTAAGSPTGVGDNTVARHRARYSGTQDDEGRLVGEPHRGTLPRDITSIESVCERVCGAWLAGVEES